MQMIGETVSKPSPADVVGSLSWQESRRKLISEKERVAAEQRLTADRNKERKAAEAAKAKLMEEAGSERDRLQAQLDAMQAQLVAAGVAAGRCPQ